jgi:hypothetical protein
LIKYSIVNKLKVIYKVEYTKYPIYKVSFGWVEKATENKKLTTYEKKLGLKVGDRYNGCIYEIIKKEEMTKEEIKTCISEHIESYSQKKEIIRFIETSIKLIGYESWVVDYFCHKTFKIQGKDDKWYLDSFENYVARKESEFEKSLIEGYDGLIPSTIPKLMGADERWRWRGENEGDPAPCKCKHCLDSEYVYINH